MCKKKMFCISSEHRRWLVGFKIIISVEGQKNVFLRKSARVNIYPSNPGE